MIDMAMSYRGSSLKFHRHLTWNHVWDCLVITDLRPIFSHLCSPLLSSPLFSLFGAHTVWRRMMNTQVSKAHVLGGPSFFLGPITSHTHTLAVYTHTTIMLLQGFWYCQDKWTSMLRPTVRPTSRLRKTCIMTSNFKTYSKLDAFVCCVIFFQSCDTSLLSYILYLPFWLQYAAITTHMLPIEWLKTLLKNITICSVEACVANVAVLLCLLLQC